MKYLGIDFGDRFVGLAMGSGGSIAVPYRILEYEGSFWTTLERIISDESIDEVVVGWPLSLSGAENERTEKTSAFIEELGRRVSAAIHRIDERMSTEAARKKTKGRPDAVAAADILQTFLDAHASSR